jgi:serine/threonine-protein kinase
MTDQLAVLSAALQGRYTIEKQVGEGGMATVYRAMDLKHHRPVAIKVLRPELSRTIGTERFLREIELAAQLQHPHVVPVYDSGAADGVLYYVMPFIEGESLRDRLQRDHSIPLDESVRLTREVASALQYAHQHGVVHRDIKPENIMLSGGHAVVADFGIARAAAQPVGAEKLTGLGIVIGTPAYMSPEQASADDVDQRSDEYSLACVFFEMATGRQAFTGKSTQALLASHITGPRPKISSTGQEIAPAAISAAIDDVLARALASDRDLRYPDVMQFAEALEKAVRQGEKGRPTWWFALAAGLIAIVAGGGAWLLRGTQTGLKEGAERIAILPFTVTGSGDATLGEGMVNLLTTNLGVVKEIKTVDPQTIFVQWRKRGGASGVDLEKALAIARASGASAALTGSVTGAGNRVRIGATLYALDGSTLGTATTEGASDSVLTLVDDLSAKLVREIWRSKEPVPSLNVAGVTTSSLPALQDYLVGEQFYRRGNWDSAQAAFNRAVEADSTFALAQYRLAMAYGWQGGYQNKPAARASGLALQYSDRLPPRERTLVRAYNLFRQFKPEAIDTARAFLQAHPGDPDGLYLLGESMYHLKEIRPQPLDSLTRPFEAVLAIDSTLTAALIHPLELSVSHRDSVRYQRYMHLLRAAADFSTVKTWEVLGRAEFGQRDFSDSTVAQLLGTGMGGFGSMARGLLRDPKVSPDDLANLFTAAKDVALKSNNPRLQEVPFLYGTTLTMLGRLKDVRAYGQEMMPGNPQLGQFMMALPAIVGYGPDSATRQFVARAPEIVKRENNNVWATASFANMALQAGDKAVAHRLLDPWMSRDTAGLTPQEHWVRPLLVAQDGWLDLLEGDTIAGLRKMQEGLDGVVNQLGSPLKDPVRFEYGRALASRPQTKARGIAMLENGFDFPLLVPATQLALGRIYEKDGQRDKAIAAYQEVTRLWATADSSLQPRVQEAKEAIARLTAEQAN